jgi:hypothetical protein
MSRHLPRHKRGKHQSKKQLTQQQAAIKHGWRSGLEEAVIKSLQARQAPFKYEPFAIPFQQPTKPRRYTPDFVLHNGIVVETKGRFETSDRQKHLLVKEQYPDLDVRFVFSNPNQRISKQSRTTYAQWCLTKGFSFASRDIPDSWLKEAPNQKSQAVIEKLLKGK